MINAGPVPTRETGLRMHLHITHGTYVGDVHQAAELKRCHREQHEDPDPQYQVAHTHDEH